MRTMPHQPFTLWDLDQRTRSPEDRVIPETGPMEHERIAGQDSQMEQSVFAFRSGLLDVELAVNELGQIEWKNERMGGEQEQTEYDYDADGRLCGVVRNGHLAEAYGYDEQGRRVVESNTLRGVEREYVYGKDGQLLRAGDCTFFAYDEDGQLIEKRCGNDISRYRYNAGGRLLEMDMPCGRHLEFNYDSQGRRRNILVNGESVVHYQWQGTRLVWMMDGSWWQFHYEDDDAVEGTRLPWRIWKDGHHYYPSYDQAGSLRAVADADGNLIKALLYDSFGNVLFDLAPHFWIPFSFAGGIVDPGTRLVHFHHRDYDPDVARWTAPDPLGLDAGDVDVYGYCLDDPINRVDPLGDFAVSGSVLAAFAAGKALSLGLAALGIKAATKAMPSKEGEEKAWN